MRFPSSSIARMLPWAGCIAATLATLPRAVDGGPAALACAAAAGLSALGVRDLLQARHAILRNYPVIGHVRYLVEAIRPEVRQYLVEGDDDSVPFSRGQRSLVYRRAKGTGSDQPFGTLRDVYGAGHEFMGHSARPAPKADPAGFRVRVGGPDCTRPYEISAFNVSAMSFGSLSANAVRALTRGAAAGGFAVDTGEGGLSASHLESGADLIWEIGSGYFGCRTPEGRFDPERFALAAAHERVRMVEIKLSQGAKPGHGGVLPGAKVTAAIAAARGVPEGVDCVSPARHPEFDTPLGLVRFVGRLRQLSGGKPVGFKLCLGHPWEFMGIVKAMLETGIAPDFIVVDGAEGGTGAAPAELSDHVGTPLREGLLFVHNALVGAGLRDRIRIGASGKVVDAFDIARVLALGADWANAARGFMFAVGCIQARTCHTNRCPTGVATQDPERQRGIEVGDKGERVRRYHAATLAALATMLSSAGLRHPSEVAPRHLLRRIGPMDVRPFSETYRFVRAGSLLDGTAEDPILMRSWAMATSRSFDALAANEPSDASMEARAALKAPFRAA